MPGELTPMMRQYFALKEKYNDCLLLFRLGDFYELFFEDAITASKELEIVLTGRDCGLDERAPMCGVPYHSIDGYAAKLIEKGYKVAICEQMEDAALAKGLVERDVIRIITPGTVIEESMLDERENSFIASVFWQDGKAGVAFADISTGSFTVLELTGEDLATKLIDELGRIQPKEVVANDGLYMQQSLVKVLSSRYYLQNYGGWAYEPQAAKDRLLSHFRVNSLSSYGIENLPSAICAAGALMAYLEETQKNALSHIAKIDLQSQSAYMTLDVTTRRNLELTKPLHTAASKKNTLLYLLDETKTAMGGRMLRMWIEQPLQDEQLINERLDTVAELSARIADRSAVRETLSGVYDIERLCSRIAYGTVNARDCIALLSSLNRLPALVELIGTFDSPVCKKAVTELDMMQDIASLLDKAVMPEPPVSVKDGGIIKDGYNNEVDQLREASKNGKLWLTQMEAKEREATGIKNLKIGYNRVFGYYIEVTKSFQHMVPYQYQRKQTLANAERYITPALKELEDTILGAEENLIALEYKLFTQIRETLLACTSRLQKNAALVAELDCLQAFSEVAAKYGYCKPHINHLGRICIKGGRHPVVERAIKDGFIENDAELDPKENRLLILTGPNMAGKSTYMRQIALIVLMAHIGCFVPAREADICMTDRIFTRVGASDDLAAGQSTFMVEMSEVANILNNATRNSLLILDEIGRGTSTFDGLSIAWSVLEHIADEKRCGAKALFATHYHELTELEGKLSGVKNYRISVKEVGDDILFLRKIMRGGADKSFGVQVAKLAGLPDSVIVRAKEILKQLEHADINYSRHAKQWEENTARQMSLFTEQQIDAIIAELKAVSVDDLSPLLALNLLNELHQRAKRLS